MRRTLRRSVAGPSTTRILIRAAGMLVLLFGLLSIIARNAPWESAEKSAEPSTKQSTRQTKKDQPKGTDQRAEKSEGPAKADSESGEVKQLPAEIVLGNGVDDREPQEMAEAQRLFDAVSDKAPISNADMPAYWRLMGWAGSQSFDELSARARRKPFFTRFFEEPDKCRGKPYHLRLHLRRILDYDAPKNSVGAERVYEFWGWTDESRSYYYVVVCPELPEGLEVDPELEAEGEFVGYFLKTLTYAAHDRVLAAPLLVGRMRRVIPKNRVAKSLNSADKWFSWGIGISGAVFVASTLWGMLRKLSRPRVTRQATADEVEVDMVWLQSVSGDRVLGDRVAGHPDSAAQSPESPVRPGSLAADLTPLDPVLPDPLVAESAVGSPAFVGTQTADKNPHSP